MSECVWMCVLRKWMDVCMGVCVSQEMGGCVGVK